MKSFQLEIKAPVANVAIRFRVILYIGGFDEMRLSPGQSGGCTRRQRELPRFLWRSGRQSRARNHH